MLSNPSTMVSLKVSLSAFSQADSCLVAAENFSAKSPIMNPRIVALLVAAK